MRRKGRKAVRGVAVRGKGGLRRRVETEMRRSRAEVERLADEVVRRLPLREALEAYDQDAKYGTFAKLTRKDGGPMPQRYEIEETADGLLPVLREGPMGERKGKTMPQGSRAAMTAGELAREAGKAMGAVLDDKSVPKQVYREALEELIADLDARLDAVDEELNREGE